MLRIQVLGHFGVRTGSERPKAVPRLVARVGCILAGWPGEWVDRQRLIEELWGDRPPRTALNTLQAHVSQLRKVVGKDLVIGDANSYLLDVDPAVVDAELFQELLHDSARAQRQLHLARAQDLLSQALSLWGGVPYVDSNDPDLRARRARLEELREVALEDRLECQLEIARDHHELHTVIANARELVSLSPLRERRHVLLIRALAAANRVAEANAALESATNHIRLVTAGEPSADITSLAASLQERSENLYPLVRSLPRIADGAAPKAVLPSEQAAFDRIAKLLVEHNASLVLLRADVAQHERIASSLAAALHGDFPRGVITERADDNIAKLAQPRHGVLRIIMQAGSSNIASFLQQRNSDEGASIICTDTEPPASLAAVTVDLTYMTNTSILQSS